MAQHNLSKIVDDQGEEYLIKAKGLESQIQFFLDGELTGNSIATTLDGNVTINATIVNGKVTHDKLGTNAVQNDKIMDGTIALDKIAAAAFGNSDPASDNDGHIVTHAQLVSYVTGLLQGYGTNYGVMSVASINAMTLDNLHNGDLVIVGGIDSEHPEHVITLGNLDVRNGENLIFHKEGTGSSATGVWQSIDGEFKLIQNAVDVSGSTLKTLTRLQQNSNGEITATFTDIQEASTSQKGVVQLENSYTSNATDKAATPSAVMAVYGIASGSIQGVKLAGAANPLAKDANNIVTIPNATSAGSTVETNGLMTVADKTKLDSVVSGATKVEVSTTNGHIIINDVDTTVYEHPTSAGWKHIPSGGSNGQILTYSADGTAVWSANAADGKVDKVTGTSGDFVFFGSNGAIVDLGLSSGDFATSGHEHGYITSAGAITAAGVAIATGDALIIADASDSSLVKKTSITFDTASATSGNVLTKKGEWQSVSTLLNVKYNSSDNSLKFNNVSFS